MGNNKIILIAGGTGLIGKQLSIYLKSKGHEVRILTRGKTNKEHALYHWNPVKEEIDKESLQDVSIIINLSGAGIADKRWTQQRKKELIDSRTVPAQFLATQAKNIKSLEHYISASGVNCYGYENNNKLYSEDDAYGDDFLSNVVQQWEKSADLFASFTKVTKIRISVVLLKDGGALPKIAKPVRFGFGAALGSGKQWMPWISDHDLIRLFEHVMNNSLEGTFNALAENSTNAEFTKAVAKTLKKPLFLPNVPSFLMRLVLGEMASVVLDGVQADNSKIKSVGFQFEDNHLDKVLLRYF